MTEHVTEHDARQVDVLAPATTPTEAARDADMPQVARISSYRTVRAIVALVALVALAAITLVLGVVGPNKWILISLSAGGVAGFVFGAIAMQILEPAPPARPSEGHDAPSPWEQFLRELDRSRRYDLTFTLARIEAAQPAGQTSPGRGGRGRRIRREASPDVSAGLRPHLRSTDLTWTEGPYVYALLPGIDSAACQRLFTRIESRRPGLIPPSGVALACFPQDGLTSNALLAALQGSADRARTGSS